MLTMRLDSHPQVQAVGEILQMRWPGPRWIIPRLREERTEYWLNLRSSNIYEYVARNAWIPRSGRVKATGFKALWEQFFGIPKEDQSKLLSVPKLRIILLERRDALRQFVSASIAKETQVWNVPIGTSLPSAAAIRLNAVDFGRFIDARKHDTAMVRIMTRHLPCLSVIYEDLVARPEHENARLCSFLGVDRFAMVDKVQKISTRSLQDQIANYAEFIEALKGTRLERYLQLAGIDD